MHKKQSNQKCYRAMKAKQQALYKNILSFILVFLLYVHQKNQIFYNAFWKWSAVSGFWSDCVVKL